VKREGKGAWRSPSRQPPNDSVAFIPKKVDIYLVVVVIIIARTIT
jgi:hypothetical protein